MSKKKNAAEDFPICSFNKDKIAENITANEEYVQNKYLDEVFIDSTEQLQTMNEYTRGLVLPVNCRVAESRASIINSRQRDVLQKELRQAGILSRMGDSVFLIPERSVNDNEVILDAIVNGELYEFRNVTGTVRQIEERFSEAKKRKGDDINVFVHIDTNASMHEAWRRIEQEIRRRPNYTGNIILSIRGGNPIHRDSSSFR